MKNMENYVHVDEKCFFLKLPKCAFYGLFGEKTPPRPVKHKSFILKMDLPSPSPANPPTRPTLTCWILDFFVPYNVKRHARSLDGIVTNVLAAWNDVHWTTLLANFRTLQFVLIEILKRGGGNGFRFPHPKKCQLEGQGRLPEEPLCPVDVLESACVLLSAEDERVHDASAEVETALASNEVVLCNAFEELQIGIDDIDEFDTDSLYEYIQL
ncbi:hypothetical protein H310_09766 [Aphanomyces invadans]|uniref:Uncharacterized protein n=1 Tax=Aphanomyces invadans TaxID=157072 RepID=A0A024TTV6_9STRA|nr:hypothetical protein H310_09766 [Aphanomyces invadans]ETV97438.1 hypothetical protein H310_09766 [Aphanomyces invadans]|eukprot:XP_008874146.1 hypothetical protein H310_09766 [Aphanomyces invadans]